MFTYNYRLEKEDKQTMYGSICIDNIVFDTHEIEEKLPTIIFEDKNLKHMFAENDLNDFKRRNIYKRFCPKEKISCDMKAYINNCMKNNKSFYSFLAEGILGLVYRDIYKFDLAKGLIDIKDTLVDSHTGVDACMYDIKKSVIVLGEAKFYGDLSGGINAIISDFISKNIKNKLESMQTAAENNEATCNILLKNLGDGKYNELTIDEFMQQRLIFAGFVLHSEKNLKNYTNEKFYEKYDISAEKLKDNICKCINVNQLIYDYKIIIVHLPIVDKSELIVKMINESKLKLEDMR